jgi:hypothetical protein
MIGHTPLTKDPKPPFRRPYTATAYISSTLSVHTLDTTALPQALRILSMVANSEHPHFLPRLLPHPLAPTTNPEQQTSVKSLYNKTITEPATIYRTYLPQHSLQSNFPHHARQLKMQMTPPPEPLSYSQPCHLQQRALLDPSST